jgi:hypothetical protein
MAAPRAAQLSVTNVLEGLGAEVGPVRLSHSGATARAVVDILDDPRLSGGIRLGAEGRGPVCIRETR